MYNHDMGNPFAFRIDYDKEIAHDERQIDFYGSQAMRLLAPMAAAFEARFPDWRIGHVDLFGWIVAMPDHASDIMNAVGLTDADMAAWGAWKDLWRDRGQPRYVDSDGWDATFWRAMVQRGEAIAARFGCDGLPLCTEGKRVALLKRAKASLARHRRNQKAHG